MSKMESFFETNLGELYQEDCISWLKTRSTRENARKIHYIHNH